MASVASIDPPASTNGGAPPPAGTKVYVGRLPPNAVNFKKDLEDLFGKYGRVVSLEIKHGGFAFLEFGKHLWASLSPRLNHGTNHSFLNAALCLDPLPNFIISIATLWIGSYRQPEDNRDADDAIAALNNYPFEGEKLVVEWSRRTETSTSTCFICGKTGHWARECPESKEQGMDVKSGKCFKCGVHGHLARFCRGDRRSRSRSPGRRGGYDRRYERSPRRYDRGGYDRRRSPDRRDRYDRGYDRGYDRYDDRYDPYGPPPPHYYPPPRSRYEDDYYRRDRERYDMPPPGPGAYPRYDEYRADPYGRVPPPMPTDPYGHVAPPGVPDVPPPGV
ncbi:hypothetical protein HDV05_004423 [Chytridiales sp. JEL 0842]|nr:hypothetical protein HDV05_004423 [Chytridiales sp. JEL 0842]